MASGSDLCRSPAVLKAVGVTTLRKTLTGFADSEWANESAVFRGMMDSPRINYIPSPDATPESELSVLAHVYAYLIKTHSSNKVTEPAQPRTVNAKSPIWRKEAEMP